MFDFKVSGIYNSKSIKYLQANGVNHFSFDLRPRSLNFIQEYLLKDLIKNNFFSNNNIYLNFENEKDFMINKVLDGLKFSGLNLEFSGNETLDFIESFKCSFIYNVDQLNSLENIIKSKYLKGLTFNYDQLLSLYNNNKLEAFVINYFNIIKNRPKDFPKLKLFLNQSWDNEIFQGILHYFKFDIINFQINFCVESSFRNLDTIKVGQYLNHWSNL